MGCSCEETGERYAIAAISKRRVLESELDNVVYHAIIEQNKIRGTDLDDMRQVISHVISEKLEMDILPDDEIVDEYIDLYIDNLD